MSLIAALKSQILFFFRDALFSAFHPRWKETMSESSQLVRAVSAADERQAWWPRRSSFQEDQSTPVAGDFVLASAAGVGAIDPPTHGNAASLLTPQWLGLARSRVRRARSEGLADMRVQPRHDDDARSPSTASASPVSPLRPPLSPLRPRPLLRPLPPLRRLRRATRSARATGYRWGSGCCSTGCTSRRSRATRHSLRPSGHT